MPSQSRRLTLYLALLAALPFVVYANGYHHAFQLDDRYTIVTNASLRSLQTVPRYFVDPATYTSVREQADYRPILQTTYALNYRMGGYTMWWWHFTQIVLHAAVVAGLFALCRRILTLSGDTAPDSIAFAAAAIFAVHPAAAGVVDYLNARSSLLTAALLLPALLLYMSRIEEPHYARPRWRTAALYALALLTKVEAVGLLGALWAYELWQRHQEAPAVGFLRHVRASFDTRTLRRLAPALAITAVYFVVRWKVMAPFPFDEARHAADVGPREYFITQLTAWWYYIFRWLAPVRLVADYLAYPVYRSLREPVVLFALGGWLTVAALLLAAWRRAPYLLFLALAALALLSPTSSVAPLAEMVNEHRPYLPIAILSLALVIPVGRALRRWPPGPARRAVAGGLAVVFLALALLTYRRNEVFATERSYWADVLAKAPSPRAHLNYGVALMSANDLTGAEREFRASLEEAPFWYFTHINLAIVAEHFGRLDDARTHFDDAVRYDKFSGLALTWRGEFHLARGEFADARDDFLASQRIALHQYRNLKGLATASAGLGDTTAARAYLDRMYALDSASAAVDAPGIANVSPGAAAGQSVDALMARGLAALTRGDAPAAAAAFRSVLAVNPTHYGAHYQLAVALDRAGKRAEARPLWERVLQMAGTFHDSSTQRTARARLSERRPQ